MAPASVAAPPGGCCPEAPLLHVEGEEDEACQRPKCGEEEGLRGATSPQPAIAAAPRTKLRARAAVAAIAAGAAALLCIFGSGGGIGSPTEAEQLGASWVNLLEQRRAETQKDPFGSEERLGRLPHEHRTITLGGFLIWDYINGRYTERFGTEFLVNGFETYWASDLRNFLYACPKDNRWYVFSASKFGDTRDNGGCWYTVAAPNGADVLDPSLLKGWSEWDGTMGILVETPTAGVDILSTQEWVESATGAYDTLDVFPECKRPPYSSIDYRKTYSGELSKREKEFSYLAVFQGTCSNCWAVAAASLIERLLCINGNSQWVGPRTTVSAGYITSCATDAFTKTNGCEGGYAVKALRWVGEHGVPTGGHPSSTRTCVPLFQINKDKETEAPSCPTQCTHQGYPRSLQADLFIPAGLQTSWQTTAFESARKALKRGPILIVIPMYEDFRNYTGGTYVHKTGKYLGDHIMVASGHNGSIIAGFNSWGPQWGWQGSYRLLPSLVKFYIIPGKIVGSGAGYPYPLPPSTMQVTIAGFTSEGLNGKYDLWMHPYGRVNGHQSYWKDDHTVLYWNAKQSCWAIAIFESMPLHLVAWGIEKHKHVFEAEAFGPKLENYANMDALPSEQHLGWFEGSGAQAANHKAGIVGLFRE